MWSDYFRVLACNLSSLKLISYLDNSFKSYCLARSSDFVGRTKKILLSYDFLKNSSFKPFTKWAKRSFVPAVMFNSSPSTCRSIEMNRSRMNRCDFFFFFSIIKMWNYLFQNSDQTSRDLLANCAGSSQRLCRIVHGNHELKSRDNLLHWFPEVFEF